MDGFTLHIDYLLNALPVMDTGYLGVFIVAAVIILVVTLLNKIGSSKD